MSAAFGEATFSAYRQDNVLHIVATGEKHSPQTKVTIEQLPFRIYPPQFGLLFESTGITNPTITPFQIERAFVDYPRECFVSVVDKTGVHTLDIVERLTPKASLLSEDFVSTDFVVYRQIGTSRYLVAKAGAVVIDIYEQVYGPDTLANCQAYAASQAVPIMPPLGIVPHSFHAWINHQPGTENGSKFVATVDVFVGVDWTVELVSAVPQGFNPLIKLLAFNVHEPADSMHSHVMVPKTFRYEETPTHNPYTDATIINANGPASTRVENIF